MKSVKEVFNAAMALMDELDGEGKAQTRDTKEYEKRRTQIHSLKDAGLIERIGSDRSGYWKILDGAN